MSHTNNKNTFVGVPKLTGGVFWVPQTATLPTNTWTPRPESAVTLGGVSEDGYTYASERQIEKRKDWNGDKVRGLQTGKDDTFETTYIEFLNPKVMEVIFGEANVTVIPATAEHGTLIAVRSVADMPDHGAYIVDTFDIALGTKRRRTFPDAQLNKMDPIIEKPGEWSVYKVTYDLYPDSQGSTNYSYTELNDKTVPSVWTVTVVPGDTPGGTYLAKVNGGTPTAGIAYNASSATFTTRLTDLLGAGKATVVGSNGGPYTVTLVDGGVLSVDDSGLTGVGASVTVAPAA